jgi:putative copper export protein
MTEPLVGGVLNFLHVVSAIGWLGAAMVFGMILSPILPSMTAAGRGEFIVKVLPKYATYVTLLILSTLVFGASLGFYMVYSGDTFSFNSQWGLAIMAGAGTALLVAVIGLGIIIPAMKKMVRIVKEMQANPSAGPSPELPGIQRRMRLGSMVGMVLLFLVVIFMVTAAWSA